MGKEKTVILRIEVDGFGTANKDLEFLTTNTAKLTNAKQEARKESAAAAKVLQAEEGSMQKLRAETALLRLEADRMRAVTKEEIDTREQLKRKINENVEAIRNHDRAISGSGTLVGEYAKGIKDAFGEMVNSLMGVGAMIGGIKIAFDKLKEAVMSTTAGIDFMNNVNQASKQIFYDLATSLSLNISKMVEAIAVQKELNQLRVEEYQNNYKTTGLQEEINELRLKAADKTQTEAERLEALNKVRDLSTEKLKIEIEHMGKELVAINELIRIRPKDEELLKEGYALMTKIAQARAEEAGSMRRVESARTGIIKEEQEKQKKDAEAFQRWMDEIEEDNRQRIEKAAKESKEFIESHIYIPSVGWVKQSDFQKAIKDKEKADKDAAEKQWNFDRMLAQKNFEAQKAEAKRQKEANDQAEQDDMERERRFAQFERQMIRETSEAKINALRSFADLSAALAGKNKEAQKIALLVEKSLAIAEIWIATVRSNTLLRANAEASVLPGPLYLPRLAAAMGLIQPAISLNNAAAIANTAAVAASTALALGQFASGGKVSGGVRTAPTSRGDDTLILAKQGEVVLNQKHQQLLGGSSTFKNIGVPGFADGGVIGSPMPDINFPGSDMSAFIMDFARMVNEKRVVLLLSDIHVAENDLRISTETSQL